MREAGSRHRRHRTLQGVRLRRQRGELTGYSSQIRLLSCEALRERHQHSCVLLLRPLNILQCRADGVWFRGCSRLVWRRCSEAAEIRQREAIEIRHGDRQGEVTEIRQGEMSARKNSAKINSAKRNLAGNWR